MHPLLSFVGCVSNLRRSLYKPEVDIPSSFAATAIRCLVDIPRKKIPSVGNGEMALYLKTKVFTQIPPELQCGFIAAMDEGSIKTMANRSMPAAPQPTPGAILLADSFNMRHPLTGGGMTLALSNVVIVRDVLRPLENMIDSYALCKYLDSFYILRKVIHAYMRLSNRGRFREMAIAGKPGL
nr:squalene monooxygenase-like [Tanacetum cinerariifolium]